MKKKGIIISYLIPRIRDVLFLSIFTAVIIKGPDLFNGDGDLGRHITIGNYIVDNLVIPQQDIFSYTMFGERLVPHEWLSQVAFAFSHRILGLSGPVLLTALIIALTFTIIYRELQKRRYSILTAAVMILWAAAAASIHWLSRPHIFTFLFVTLWTFGLEDISESRSTQIWRFPLLMLVWVNMHGAFIAAFVIWAVYFVEWLWMYRTNRESKQVGINLLWIGVLSFGVTFINPSGWHLWETSVGYLGNEYLVDNTVEYMSPDFHKTMMWPFLMMIVIGLFSLLWERRFKLREILLLAGWAAMGLYSARNIPLFAIVTAPIYCAIIESQIKKIPIFIKLNVNVRKIEGQLRGILWPILTISVCSVLLFCGISIDKTGTGNHYDPTKFPVEAVDWLQENPQQGNLFNFFSWGGYLLYRMWPEELVFIDGQTDFYGETLTRAYASVITISNDWDSILDEYSIQWILMPSDSLLPTYLKNDSHWKIVYEDQTTIILHKYPKYP